MKGYLKLIYDQSIQNGKDIKELAVKLEKNSSAIRHYKHTIHGTENETGVIAKLDIQRERIDKREAQCNVCNNSRQSVFGFMKWAVPLFVSIIAICFAYIK